MDASTITGYAVTVIGGLFTLVGGTLVAVMARKSARTATESSERIATQQHELDAVTAFKDTYKDSVAELRKQVGEVRAEMEEADAKIAALKVRVEEVERDRDTERTTNRLLRGYVQELVQVLRDNDMDVPDPPEGLVLEL